MNHPGRSARTLRRVVALLSAVLLGTGLPVIAPTPAGADPVGYVRLAHLSPDTPAVDVYLTTEPASAEPQVFPAVGYGVLSDYLPLAPGRYAVAMRTAGAPATDPPVLTTEVAVTAGKAYTVAGVGRYADLGLRVLDDDLTAPAKGRAKVRVIQASVRAPLLDVATVDGPTIASGVQFATTTPYTQVEPGSWKLRLEATGMTPATGDMTVDKGVVYSLLVLDDQQSGLSTELRIDAEGDMVVPAGNLTGSTSEQGDMSYPLVALGVVALLAVVVTAAALVLRRRARHTQ
ncbi:hypothetical protein GCM10027290_38400 [Micromonospora sonneratiae]|uniref:DUF4397 domain-containing protein n=1 Tax=Micromonospora sonneratiae TaxID=1184706 RepID=A0ABW3YA56_9ACTN